MRAKFINEDIEDFLKPKSKEEIFGKVGEIVNFKPSDQNGSGTSLMGYIQASYKDLVKLFGPPKKADNYKVSTEWIVEDESGNVATIYDWKSTNLYDEGLESIRQLRALPLYDWHIGAHNKEIAHNLIMFINTKKWYSDES